MTRRTMTTIPNSKRSARKPNHDRAKSAKVNSFTEDGAEARLRQMLAAMFAFREGNFSARLPSDWDGMEGQIAGAFNQVISHEDRLSREVERLSHSVGREGRLKQRMSLPGAIGGWAAKVDCFNTLLDDLCRPTTEISRTIGAVAKGDLGQSMELEVDGRSLKGEFLRSQSS
jgi:hypothetical protein